MDIPDAGTDALPARYWRPEAVDWSRLGDDLGVTGAVRHGGHSVARSALAALLGDEFWAAAVRRDIADGPLPEPVHSVLCLVRPPAAVAECVRVLREGTGDDRLWAVHLLRDVAGAEELRLVPELLTDGDPRIPVWGAVMLQNLILDDAVDAADVEPLLADLERHADPAVREVAAQLRSWGSSREV